MKKWSFWIALVCYTNAVHAGPFGLEMGTSLAVLQKQLVLHPEKPYHYRVQSLPKGHPAFEDYTLVVTKQHGLCQILAFSKKIETNVYGDALKSAFKDLETPLTAKYGPGERLDFLRSGSIWNESRDWMMGLRKEERKLATSWSAKDRELPDNIGVILLRAFALSTEKGRVVLGYQSKTYFDCLDWIKAQKDAPL